MEISQRIVNNYKKLFNSAISAGVSFEDLIQETRNYHGDEFTLNLLKKMRN